MGGCHARRFRSDHRFSNNVADFRRSFCSHFSIGSQHGARRAEPVQDGLGHHQSSSKATSPSTAKRWIQGFQFKALNFTSLIC